jgi:hypothetical protein
MTAYASTAYANRLCVMRHRQTKGPETDRSDLPNRVTPRLYPNLPVQVRSLVANPPETSFVRRTLTGSIC